MGSDPYSQVLGRRARFLIFLEKRHPTEAAAERSASRKQYLVVHQASSSERHAVENAGCKFSSQAIQSGDFLRLDLMQPILRLR